MKNNEAISQSVQGAYIAPEVEVIEVEVEKGFAVSNAPGENFGPDNWGW